MKWSAQERQQFLGKLEGIERAMTTFYRLLLSLIVAAIVAVVVLVVMYRPWVAGSQGEWFYFAIAVLLVLGWVLGQFMWLARRRCRRRLPVTFHASDEDGGRAWELRIGSPAADPQHDSIESGQRFQTGFSQSFTLPLASLAAEVLPDEDTITCLEAELARGVDLEQACRRVQPAFDSWTKLMQRAYCRYVTSVLESRAAK